MKNNICKTNQAKPGVVYACKHCVKM